MAPIRILLLATIACLGSSVPQAGAMSRCPEDSVKVGSTCIDRYEASVWMVPLDEVALLRRIGNGRATLEMLTAAGAVQLGCAYAPFNKTAYPPWFPVSGNWKPELGSSPPSPGVYALSIPGVEPSTCTSWFQAVQACALSGKRLIRNEEWQRAAAGTPDSGTTDNGTTDCATDGASLVLTGARSECVSHWGAHDMVGNALEWVSDWADRANGHTDWTSQTGIGGGDYSVFGGANGAPSDRIPAPLTRGGNYQDGNGAGVFAVSASGHPAGAGSSTSFRCAR